MYFPKYYLAFSFKLWIFLMMKKVEATMDICYNSTLEGYRLNATVIKAKVVWEKIDCIIECAMEQCCRSINYRKSLTFENEPNCEMLHNVIFNTSEKLLEKDVPYDYVYLINPRKDYNQKCLPWKKENISQVSTVRPSFSRKMFSSCKELLDHNSSLPSGVYELQSDDQTKKYLVYCKMEPLDNAECSEKGWTLVLKTAGNTGTFKYDSELWENNQTLNVLAGVDQNVQETKLSSYNYTPFSKICLGMTVNSNEAGIKWIAINNPANSLYSLIADSKYRNVAVEKTKWMSLIPDSHLPNECQYKGFNTHVPGHPTEKRVRIGYLAHQRCGQEECLTGFGTDLFGFRWSSGYICPSRQGNLPKQISAIGYIFVR